MNCNTTHYRANSSSVPGDPTYYEDIPNEVYFQNQILRGWYLWPLQLFCFNFGATHIIHHYVINQPFYLRQMVARRAHAAMTEHGVRVNDLGTVARANRWGETAGAE